MTNELKTRPAPMREVGGKIIPLKMSPMTATGNVNEMPYCCFHGESRIRLFYQTAFITVSKILKVKITQLR
jgi:hypothetical protein